MENARGFPTPPCTGCDLRGPWTSHHLSHSSTDEAPGVAAADTGKSAESPCNALAAFYVAMATPANKPPSPLTHECREVQDRHRGAWVNTSPARGRMDGCQLASPVLPLPLVKHVTSLGLNFNIF